MSQDQNQINEWTENPITQAFLEVLQRERDELAASRGLEAFTPFDAHKTQEVLANLNGYVDAMDTIIAALGGDWSSLEEEE